MYSIEVVLLLSAVTFVFAYTMGYTNGFWKGKEAILNLLTKSELIEIAKRLNIPTVDED